MPVERELVAVATKDVAFGIATGLHGLSVFEFARLLSPHLTHPRSTLPDNIRQAISIICAPGDHSGQARADAGSLLRKMKTDPDTLRRVLPPGCQL